MLVFKHSLPANTPGNENGLYLICNAKYLVVKDQNPPSTGPPGRHFRGKEHGHFKSRSAQNLFTLARFSWRINCEYVQCRTGPSKLLKCYSLPWLIASCLSANRFPL